MRFVSSHFCLAIWRAAAQASVAFRPLFICSLNFSNAGTSASTFKIQAYTNLKKLIVAGTKLRVSTIVRSPSLAVLYLSNIFIDAEPILIQSTVDSTSSFEAAVKIIPYRAPVVPPITSCAIPAIWENAAAGYSSSRVVILFVMPEKREQSTFEGLEGLYKYIKYITVPSASRLNVEPASPSPAFESSSFRYDSAAIISAEIVFKHSSKSFCSAPVNFGPTYDVKIRRRKLKRLYENRRSNIFSLCWRGLYCSQLRRPRKTNREKARYVGCQSNPEQLFRNQDALANINYR